MIFKFHSNPNHWNSANMAGMARPLQAQAGPQLENPVPSVDWNRLWDKTHGKEPTAEVTSWF